MKSGKEERAEPDGANLREGCNPRSREFRGGILRVDSAKPRRSSAEFHNSLLSQGDLPLSPLPSVDRLSVTFADESLRSDASTRCNLFNPNSGAKMDKVHFPEATDNSDDEDYSACISATMIRRASTKKAKRRGSRRASSPFVPDILPGPDGRRRSSVYTTSSGDTAITMDDSLTAEVTQEQILENIKLHQEVLRNVKMQPWNMRKKIRLVNQAKTYIKKHEGILHEKLAQSKSTKDILARWNLYLAQKWDRYRREMADFSNWFLPWERNIKEIESHFGSVVASYFTFLRWLFWVNIVIAAVLLAFVTVPEMLTANTRAAGERKLIQPGDKYNATNFLTLWDFEGIFKYSPIFYGWYTNEDNNKGYRLPFAYFVTGLVVYAYSFFAILRRMALNSRMSKLSEKDDECIFSWKLFTGWDYMIGNPETAHNRVASNVMGLRAALLEEAEKKREDTDWKVIAFRILVNIGIIGLLSFSVYAVILVVNRSKEPEAMDTGWRRNEIQFVIGLMNAIFPTLFEIIGFVEHHHPRTQLRIQLGRIMVLYLLSLYALIFAQFSKIIEMTEDLQTNSSLNENSNNVSLTTPKPECTEICTTSQTASNLVAASQIITAVVTNMSASTLPKLLKSYSTNSYESTTDNGFIGNFTQFIENDNFTSFIYEEDYNKSYSVENFTYVTENFTYMADNFSFLAENSTFLAEKTSDIEIKPTEDYVYEYDYAWGFENISDLQTNSTDYPAQNSTDPFLNTSTTIQQTSTDLTSVSYRYITTTPVEPSTTEQGKENLTTLPDEVTTASASEESSTSCYIECKNASTTALVLKSNITHANRTRLQNFCWETMFGQELVKLTIMDLILTVAFTLGVDFFRGIFVRVMNNCWCWDLEKTFPQYADFKVAENILHLVNNQGMVWMGMFFAPGIVLMNVIKLYVMMYFRTWTVLTCNVPHKIIFRASKSNNFYYGLLLMMLFLCVLPVAYAIVWLRPSWHCGPFSSRERIFHIFTETVRQSAPKWLQVSLDYIASPSIVIPLLVLLILIIYYLLSLTSALREANNDLKIQLRRERTEERRKMFQIADRRRRVGSSGSADLAHTPFAKWKKLVSDLPYGKSMDETPKQESQEAEDISIKEKIETNNKSKDFFSKLIKIALRKGEAEQEEDGTDNEQQECLPEDVAVQKQTNSDDRRAAPVVLKPEEIVEEDGRKKEDVKETSQDSSGSVWSEKIPMITISKSESPEVVDQRKFDPEAEETNAEVEPIPSCSGTGPRAKERFKPKIRYALKKQDAEIDIDSITYISDEFLQRIELSKNKEENQKVEILKAAGQNSLETTKSGSQKTESSSDYKDTTITSE